MQVEAQNYIQLINELTSKQHRRAEALTTGF